MKGTKINKYRITIALSMNSDGKEKLKPLIINKSRRPRSFGKTFNPQNICSYYHNAKAWMIVFRDWLLKLNNKMMRSDRKILLLVDNAGGHNMNSDTVKNVTHVRVEYFPPNCTSVLQPADAGIIKSFKNHYSSSLVNFLAKQIDDDEYINELIMPDLKEALYLIINAWSTVSEKTITNCFNYCDIIGLYNNVFQQF